MDKKEIYQEKIKAQLEKVSDHIYQLKAMRALIGLELRELKETLGLTISRFN